MLGLRFCARAFSSCGKRGPLFIAVRGSLTIAASLVAEHRLQTRRLSSCGARAWLLRGMWNLPRPGLEPVSPALAGRLSTTAPPGKPLFKTFKFPFPTSSLSVCIALGFSTPDIFLFWSHAFCFSPLHSCSLCPFPYMSGDGCTPLLCAPELGDVALLPRSPQGGLLRNLPSPDGLSPSSQLFVCSKEGTEGKRSR